MSQMKNILTITGTLRAQSGLRIGAGRGEMHIGGTDNEVLKHPITQEPYIPGSSIKGKLRSLLEWHAGLATLNGGKPTSLQVLDKVQGEQRQRGEAILKLFGVSGGDLDKAPETLAPTRGIFRDAPLTRNWVDARRSSGEPLVETKSENSIDRITGVAGNPRQTERVPADATFELEIHIRQLYDGDEHLLDLLLTGLRLLEMDALGGSGSRGYGKVIIEDLRINGEPADQKLKDIQPF